MNIAIFADVHGRILLAFKLCARWQRETGEKIDLILQAGDLGAYPDISRLDRATIKHAQKDPSELGFSQYFVDYDSDIANILAQTSAPMLFVRGNHEDHQWLDELESDSEETVFPIDAYQRIYCMKTGHIHTFSSGDASINILGIGRIAPLPGEQDETKPKYIQLYEIDRINHLPDKQIDMLLTHDTALDFVSVNIGMEEIRLVLDIFRPNYHFHGHTEAPFNQQADENGVTQVIKLSDLHWDKSGKLEQGAMGILKWHNQDNHSFEVVTTDWMQEYTENNWQKID